MEGNQQNLPHQLQDALLQASKEDAEKDDDMRALRVSTASSSMAAPSINGGLNVIKDGFLCQKTEHYRLLGSKLGSAATLGKTWKVYRAVLRGTKLYFYKAPNNDIDYRLLFPNNSASGEGSKRKISSFPISRENSGSIASSRPSTPGNEPATPTPINTSLKPQITPRSDSLPTSPTEGKERGLSLVPSMFDASTRLLLFSDTIIPQSSSISSKRESQVITSPTHVKSSISLISKYEFGDAFIELELSDNRFKQQLVLLIFDDNLMILTKKWVRITRSIEVAPEKSSNDISKSNDSIPGLNPIQFKLGDSSDVFVGGSQYSIGTSKEFSSSKELQNQSSKIRSIFSPSKSNMSGSETALGSADRISALKAASAKTMTKLTFDVTYPIDKVEIKSIDPDVEPPSLNSGRNEPFYAFEVTLPDSSKRLFRARHFIARERFIQKFDSAKAQLTRVMKADTADRKISSVDIAKMWGQDYSADQNDVKTPQASKRMRKFWGIGRHPELFCRGTSSTDQEIVGASTEGYVHEYLFRNLKTQTPEFYQSIGEYLRILCYSNINCYSILDETLRLIQVSFEKQDFVVYPTIHHALDLICAILPNLENATLERVDTILSVIECREVLNEECHELLQNVKEKCDTHFQETDFRKDSLSQSIPIDIPNGKFAPLIAMKIPSREIAKQIFLFHAQKIQDLAPLGVMRFLVDSLVEIWNNTLNLNVEDLCFLLPFTFPVEKNQLLIFPHPYIHPLSQFVIRQIIVSARTFSPSKRSLLLSHWIHVADHLLNDFGDIYGWKCIAVALGSTEIVRLADTWKYIPKEIGQKVVQWLAMIINGNSPKCVISIPALGDVISEYVGTSSYLQDSSEVEIHKRGWHVHSSAVATLKIHSKLLKHYNKKNLIKAIHSNEKNENFSSWLNTLYVGKVVHTLENEFNVFQLLRGLLFPALEVEKSYSIQRFLYESKKSYIEDSLVCEQPSHYVVSSFVPLVGVNHVPICDFNGYFESFNCQSMKVLSHELPKDESHSPKKKSKKDADNSKTKYELISDSNNELVFVLNLENKVCHLKAGSLERLIDYLVYGIQDLNDIAIPADAVTEYGEKIFVDAFFASYRSICRPASLVEDLKKRFNELGPRQRLKIIEIFDFWINDYFEDFLDDILLVEKLFKSFTVMARNDLQEQMSKSLEALYKKTCLQLHSPSLSCIGPEEEMLILASPMTENAVNVDIDGALSQDLVSSLQYLLAKLYHEITQKEWIQFLNVLLNAYPYLVVDAHNYGRYVKHMSINDEPVDITNVFTALSFLDAPSAYSVSKPPINAKSSSLPNLTKSSSPIRENANKDSGSSISSINISSNYSNTFAPLISLFPLSIQRVFFYCENLKLWVTHCVVSASSSKHRIARIKLLLDTCKSLRKSLGGGNSIVGAIINGLLSQSSRVFSKTWSVLDDMPVEGTDLKQKKDQRNSFENAESYVDLLEALYNESNVDLLPTKLLNNILLGHEKHIKNPIASFGDSVEFFIGLLSSCTDMFHVLLNEEQKLQIYAFNETSRNSGIRGLSADMGLPLINFEKRLMVFALAKQLYSAKIPKIIPGKLNLDFLSLPDYIRSHNSTFLFDFESANNLMKQDPDSKGVKFSKLKFFVKLSEIEKDLKKIRDKNWKKISEGLEKDKDRLKKEADINEPKKLDHKLSKGLGIANSPAPTGSSPMLSNLLKLNTFKSKSSSPGRSINNSLGISSNSGISTSSPHLNLSEVYHSVPALSEKVVPERKDRPKTASSAMENQTFVLLSTSLDRRYAKPVKTVPLLHSRAHVAADYLKRAFVFRILTEDEQEILLQAVSKEEMHDWIRKLNDASMEGIRKLEDGVEHRVRMSTELGQKETRLKVNESENKTPKSSSKNNLSKKIQEDTSQGRTFGCELISILLHEVKEKEEFERLQLTSVNNQTKDSHSVLTFWKKAKQQENPTYLLASPAEENSIQWTEDNSLPIIVEKCLSEVNARGLHEVGIYRLSGTNTIIKELKKCFDTDPHMVDLSHPDYADINVVTGVLKLWFRELPDPLLTFELFDEFMIAAEVLTLELPEYDDRLIRIKDLIHQLPKPNYFILKSLLEHLDRVTDFEEDNHMYASNLAIVFGPTLLKPPPAKWYQAKGLALQQEQQKSQQITISTSSEYSLDLSTNGVSNGLSNSMEQLLKMEGSSMEMANTMKHLGKCNTIIKNMILQYHWLFDVEREVEESAISGNLGRDHDPAQVKNREEHDFGVSSINQEPMVDNMMPDPNEEYMEEVLPEPILITTSVAEEDEYDQEEMGEHVEKEDEYDNMMMEDDTLVHYEEEDSIPIIQFSGVDEDRIDQDSSDINDLSEEGISLETGGDIESNSEEQIRFTI